MPIRIVSRSGSTSSTDPAAVARQKVWETLPAGVRQNPSVRKKFGLGDAVAAVARPFARLIGKTNCKPCKDRQERLNRMLPSLNPFRIGQQTSDPPTGSST